MGVVNVTLPKNTLKFESRIFRAIRVRIIDNRVSGPKFRALFMVRVRFRVISGYDVIINICTALR